MVIRFPENPCRNFSQGLSHAGCSGEEGMESTGPCRSETQSETNCKGSGAMSGHNENGQHTVDWQSTHNRHAAARGVHPRAVRHSIEEMFEFMELLTSVLSRRVKSDSPTPDSRT